MIDDKSLKQYEERADAWTFFYFEIYDHTKINTRVAYS